MKEFDCPLDVVEEARRLASQIEAQDLPLDFDPADLGWKQNLLRIAREYTNYEVLSDQIDHWLIAARKERGIRCRPRAPDREASSELACPDCPDHWLAQQELSKAAQAVAERMYQTWLARRALDRGKGRT